RDAVHRRFAVRADDRRRATMKRARRIARRPSPANEVYYEGWGVVGHDGLDVRTVCESRRAAIVNWPVLPARCAGGAHYSDQQIEWMWDTYRDSASAVVTPVRIYVDRSAAQ